MQLGTGPWASVSGFLRDLKKAMAGGKESCVISESQPNPNAGPAALEGGAWRVLGEGLPSCSPLGSCLGRAAKEADTW